MGHYSHIMELMMADEQDAESVNHLPRRQGLQIFILLEIEGNFGMKKSGESEGMSDENNSGLSEQEIFQSLARALENGPDEGLFQSVARFFEEDDWKFEIANEGVLVTGIKGKNGSYKCLARVREGKPVFSFYVNLDFNVAEDKRPQVSEFMTRANYGMVLGNFEMDFDDGEVRFKISVDVGDGALTQGMIRRMVYVSIMTMDRYVPGLMSVIHAGLSPEIAIAKIEAD